jgi:ketosteroid isomerase-like protein
MRWKIWMLAAAACLVAGCGKSVNVEQERNALLALDREWSQTTTDLNKFVSYYTADASLYPQGMPVATGTEAIREALTKMSSMPGFSLHWDPTKADVSASGDLAYTTGTYQMAMNDAAGKPMTEKGKYVTVWKKQQNGQWKAADDIFNADAPPPPPAPATAAKPKRAAPARSTPRRSAPRKR